MGWQADTFARLRDREWHRIGDLFEAVEAQIPLHIAMRHAMRQSKRLDGAMPANSTARWEVFQQTLGTIGVECERLRNRKWADEVRLRHVDGRVCGECGGPVIKSRWSARPTLNNSAITCLACEHPKPAETPIPAPAPKRPVELPEVIEPAFVHLRPQPLLSVQTRVDLPIFITSLPRDQEERQFAGFLKRVALGSLSVSRIVKMLRQVHGDFNALLMRFGKTPIPLERVTQWRLLNHYQTHPP